MFRPVREEHDHACHASRVRAPGLIAAASAATLLPAAGHAKVNMPVAQAPYFYRFRLGDARATVISDGPLPLGALGDAFLGLSKEEMERQLSDNFLPTDKIVLEQNILVITINNKTALFDTGMGSLRMFGPSTGHMMRTLKAAGNDPGGVDAIVLSHAHIDHCGGVMTADGKRNFPNAQIYITQADFDYWMNEATVGPNLRAFWQHAHKNVSPNRDRIRFIKDGEEFLPGITAIHATGHTAGHCVFMINSAGKSLCYIGDLTHHPVLLMEKPRTEFAYDTDPKKSAESRVRMLDMLAANRIPILAYHFAWPGIGHVARFNDGFRYLPTPMKMMKVGA